MYMVCETLGGDDFRLLPKIKQMYQHWIFSVYYVPDSIKIDLNDYNAIEVEEDVAKSMKFAMVDKGKIGIRTGTDIHEDIFAESMEATGEKQYYYLTEEDDRNTVELMKAEMRLYLDMHYNKLGKDAEKYKGKKQAILQLIKECSSITDCQKLQHTHFGVENVSHAKKDWNLGEATVNLSEPKFDPIFQ
jgi:hypothetical protein